jgi:hypothetical protein
MTASLSRSRSWAALLLLGYVAVAALAYGRAVRLSWCCDDTQVLLHAWRYAPWRYFIEPEAWRALVPFSLTPWLSLSHRIDLGLFGFDPAAFYAHQLLMLAAGAWLIHLLAARPFGHLAGAVGGLLFLAGAPVAQASEQLMVRHYVEGLVALLATLWLVREQALHPRAWRAVAVALCFAVAASAKEVYLPLGLTALLVAPGPLRTRLRAAWPVGLVMVLYVPWRVYMLGDLLGGYTPPAELQQARSLVDVLAPFAAVPPLLFSRPMVALIAIATLVGLAGLAFWAGRTGVGVAGPRVRRAPQRLAGWAAAHLLVVALLWAPLLPLTVYPGIGPGSERYFFAVWAALSLALALWVGRAMATGVWLVRGLALVAALAVLATAGPMARRAVTDMAPMHREHRAHFEFLTQAGPNQVLLTSPRVAPWFIQGALALREALGARGEPPQRLVDESQWAAPSTGPGTVWQYDDTAGRLVDAAPRLAGRLADWRARVRQRPMQVDMHYDGPTRVLRWHLSPEQSGDFVLLSADERLAVPFAKGALRLEKPLPPCFRIRHNAPDGTVAYSPWLRLSMSIHSRSERVWQGESDSLADLQAAPRCPR